MKNEIKFLISIFIAIIFGVIANATSSAAKTSGHYLGIVIFSALLAGIIFWLLGKMNNSKSFTSRKTVRNINKATKEKISQVADQSLRQAALTHRKESPLTDSPIEGITLSHAINGYADAYKKELNANRDEIGLNENEINRIIEHARTKVLNEFIQYE